MKSKTSTHNRAREVRAFRKKVWDMYRAIGRHDLPWRHTKDPYKILVSEMMLQQTQVSRVLPKYRELLKAFPTVHALAKAPLHDVLKLWSGLGYNRRAKFLHDAAKEVVRKHKGRFPREHAALRALPGIGDYTTKAILAFAFNQPEVFIETNVRTVFFYHFFSQNVRPCRSNILKIADKEIVPYMELAAKGQDPREWHWALMDYGAHLKQSGVHLNARSKHYVKQSKFEGSLRQVRGAILREDLSGIKGKNAVRRRLTAFDLAQFEQAYASLVREGLVKQ